MADIQLLSRNTKFEEVIHPVDMNGSVTTGDYVKMQNYDGIYIVNYQGTAGGTVTITVTQTTEDADAGSDSKAIGSGKSITAVANTVTAVNIAAEEMDADNNFAWLKIVQSDPSAASVGCVFAVGYRARYNEDTMPDLV